MCPCWLREGLFPTAFRGLNETERTLRITDSVYFPPSCPSLKDANSQIQLLRQFYDFLWPAVLVSNRVTSIKFFL